MPSAPKRFAETFEIWNRKLHYCLGLYFLFFLWLFAFTGLLLNHSWAFFEFWPNRKISTVERSIQAPSSGGDLDQAKELLRQLGIQGEVDWTTTRPNPGRFDFRAARPGRVWNIQADLTQGRARVELTEINVWGILRVLHTFTGVRTGDSRNRRDWVLTTAWALSMDAVAAGLVLMMGSSYYMWFRLPQKRKLGIVALALGTASCGLFVFGLRWLYS
jgi:hypothetical protein